MIKAEVDYYRVVGGGLNEFLDTEYHEVETKTELMKIIREHKKNFSKLCRYCITGDKIYTKIVYH